MSGHERENIVNRLYYGTDLPAGTTTDQVIEAVAAEIIKALRDAKPIIMQIENALANMEEPKR